MRKKDDALETLAEDSAGRGTLSLLAAKQLREEAVPLVPMDAAHPLTIALTEIAAGKMGPAPDPAPLAPRSSTVPDDASYVHRAFSAEALAHAARTSRPAEDLMTTADGGLRPLSREEREAWGLGALALPPEQ